MRYKLTDRVEGYMRKWKWTEQELINQRNGDGDVGGTVARSTFFKLRFWEYHVYQVMESWWMAKQIDMPIQSFKEVWYDLFPDLLLSDHMPEQTVARALLRKYAPEIKTFKQVRGKGCHDTMTWGDCRPGVKADLNGECCDEDCGTCANTRP